ncbi:MAG: LysR family transcriptional regulator [Neisseriaceae bacterium]|nr:MAG: LysR family transcriptional regulator [Neisseriaceae bacterium]
MLDDILLFLKIVELGSFRKAATSLRLSLSTVSKRISALENRLDNKLMERDAKSITLTDYGRLICVKFQSLSMYYSQIENVNNDYKIQKGQVDDCVTLYIGVHIAEGLVNQSLESFLESNPKLKLNFISITLPNSITNKIDGIILTSKFFELTGFNTKLLCNYNFQFFCSRDYALSHGVPKTVAELSKHKLIGGISEEYKPLSHFYMKNHITNEKILLNAEHLQLKMNHISFLKEIGVKSNAIFPCWAALCQEELLSGEIIRVLPDWTVYTGQIYLIAKNDPSPAEQLVIDFLIECCSEPLMEVYSNQI